MRLADPRPKIHLRLERGLVRPGFIIPTLIILMALIWAANPQGQTNQIKFQPLRGEHGLSQVTVRCILQDHKGFIWFGTQDGLNKFDGYSFTVYRHDEEEASSLSNNSIASLYEDKAGTLWVGTVGGGLNRFDRATETFTRYLNDEANPQSLGSDYITFISEGEAGNLWVGTDRGLDLLNTQTGEFTHYQNPLATPRGLSDIGIRWLLVDETGALLLWTNQAGLQRLEPRAGALTDYLNGADAAQSLKDFPITSLYQDADGILWIGTDGGGLYRFDRSKNELTRYQHDLQSSKSIADNSVQAICQDRAGTLWLGTNGGLDYFDQQNQTFIHYRHDPARADSLAANSIVSLYADRSGVLWVGTSSGANKLNPNDKHLVTYRNDPDNPNSLSDNSVRSLYQDGAGKLWIGTDSGGLNRYDRETGEVRRYQHNASNPQSLSHNDVTAIREDRAGALWVGTNGGGLNRFDRERETFTRYLHDPTNPHSLSDNTVWVLLEDSAGTLWIGTANGLDKFDPRIQSFTHYRNDPANPQSLSQNNIRALWEDGSGGLWVGTRSGGLDKFDRQSETFRHYRHERNNPTSLSSDAVYALYQDETGTLWAGTTEGLNRLDPERQAFTHITEKDGLANNTVYAILGDREGQLWVSSDKGISRFNPQTRAFRNYDVDDGLQDNEFNGGAAFQSPNGEMFFGGIRGFNSFRPEEMRDSSFQPPVVLTAFSKFDQKVKLGQALDETDELVLSYKDYVFSFEFAALDYTAPQKNQYAYKLEGFDQDWNYSGTRRVAIYTNLGGGDYVFTVKGTNSDGVWSGREASIRIRITPPFWRRWWFMALASGVVVLAGFLLYRRRISRLQRARAAQEEFSRQLIESQERERKRIAAELHDSLGQNLLIIKNRALLGLTPQAPPTVSLEQLNEISATATQAIEEVREIARNLHPYKLDRLGLTKALESIIEQAAASSEINFAAQVDPVNNLFSKEAEINLYRIVQESINNILKHSQATEVHLLVKREEPSLHVEIRDNGVGFEAGTALGEDAGRRGFGLAGISERVRIIGGKHWIRSSPGQGTTITLKIELRDNQHETRDTHSHR